MSFSIQPQQVDAAQVDPVVSAKNGSEREAAVLAIVQQALKSLAHALGGHVAISASGHVNDSLLGQGGDNVNIQVNTILPPAPPVPDAGLEAAAGSPRNFPPEASTAAPATADDSPPATQEPIPQPVPPGEAPGEQPIVTGVEPQAVVDPTPLSADTGTEETPSGSPEPDPTSETSGVPVEPDVAAAPQTPDPASEPEPVVGPTLPESVVSSPAVDPAPLESPSPATPETPVSPVTPPAESVSTSDTVHLDFNGNGWVTVSGAPASFAGVSIDGPGTVRFQGVDGEPDQTCVIVESGVPNGMVVATLSPAASQAPQG